ncbi:MAG: hypothetical protein ACREQA_19610 [Candidatus Binatia bacterium]
MNALKCRTESQLLHALANEIRLHPYRDFAESLHTVMHGETHDRWINLVAALSIDLHTSPLNRFDEDSSLSQPACYAEQLRVWAAQIRDYTIIAATIDELANRNERELHNA